jgi:hypothetical protein
MLIGNVGFHFPIETSLRGGVNTRTGVAPPSVY